VASEGLRQSIVETLMEYFVLLSLRIRKDTLIFYFDVADVDSGNRTLTRKE